jgi:hypothetical protein
MVGVNPPGHFLSTRMSRSVATPPSAPKMTAAVPGPMTSPPRCGQANAEIPDRWLFLPIKKGNVRIASFFGLMESVPAGASYAGPTIANMWLSAAEGDASGLWSGSFIADVLFPRLFVWGQYAAFGSADDQTARDYFCFRRARRRYQHRPFRDDICLGWRPASRCLAGGT